MLNATIIEGLTGKSLKSWSWMPRNRGRYAKSGFSIGHFMANGRIERIKLSRKEPKDNWSNQSTRIKTHRLKMIPRSMPSVILFFTFILASYMFTHSLPMQVTINQRQSECLHEKLDEGYVQRCEVFCLLNLRSLIELIHRPCLLFVILLSLYFQW